MRLTRLWRFDRALLERLILAVVLPAVAGASNAAGLIAVGSYTRT